MDDLFLLAMVNWARVGLIKEQATREFLESLVKVDSAPEVRKTALAALAEHWPDTKTRKFLERILWDDKDPSVRLAAFNARHNTWVAAKQKVAPSG